MDIREILERKSPAYYTISEMEFAVQSYIQKKTNRTILLNVHKNFKDLNKLNPFAQFELQKEYSKLMKAFTIVQNNYYK